MTPLGRGGRKYRQPKNDVPSADTIACASCGGTEFLDRVHTGDRVCTQCGAVCESGICYGRSDYRHATEHFQCTRPRGPSGAYRRVYHWNERMAQYRRTGPACPAWLVGHVADAARRAARGRSKEDAVNYEFIRSVCGALGRHGKKYAERWVDCRARVLRVFGVATRMAYPSLSAQQRIDADFARASLTFDRHFYRAGRRRTCKDNKHGNAGPLARHNFPSYNFAAHHLFFLHGCRKRTDCHRWFPIAANDRVLRKLQKIWEMFCLDNDWPVTPLEHIMDRSYTHDYELSDGVDWEYVK